MTTRRWGMQAKTSEPRKLSLGIILNESCSAYKRDVQCGMHQNVTPLQRTALKVLLSSLKCYGKIILCNDGRKQRKLRLHNLPGYPN